LSEKENCVPTSTRAWSIDFLKKKPPVSVVAGGGRKINDGSSVYDLNNNVLL